MSNRNNAFYETYVSKTSSSTYTESRVRYRDILSATNVRVGDFVHPTPHSYERTRIWYPKGTRQSTNQVDTGPFGEDYGFVIDETQAASQDSVYNEALRKLYEQLRDSDLNLTVDAAEWKQLDRMLGHTSKKLQRLYKYARRAKKKQRYGMTVAEAENAIGNAWLAYRYGWMPFLSSIYGVATYARHIASRRKLKARAKCVNVWSRSVAASGFVPPHQYTVSHSRRCEIGIIYRIAQPWLFNTTRIVSLNPLAIAWELLPYSFVVDWFIDIGGYMQELEQSMFLGLTFEQGYVTFTDKVVVTGQFKGSWSNGTATINAPFKTQKTRLGRTALTAPPRPALPSFDVHMGWQRMLSAAALLRQILSPDPRLFRTPTSRFRR